MSEAKLPTAEEIAELPRWARVAFAARCARRALPLFAQHWPAAPEEHLRAIERAISVAEAAAAEAAAAEAAAAEAAAAEAAADAAAFTATATAHADGAVIAATAPDDDDTVAYVAAYAAAYAAAAAAAAAYATAAAAAADAGIPIALIAADFATIHDAAIRGNWSDHTPVPPSVFGPIDEPASPPPASEPAAAPQPEPRSQLKLRVYRSASTPDEVVGTKLVELYEKLNEYCLAKYGTWLTEKQFEQFVHTGVLEPSPTGGP